MSKVVTKDRKCECLENNYISFLADAADMSTTLKSIYIFNVIYLINSIKPFIKVSASYKIPIVATLSRVCQAQPRTYA